jgi:hypothetical protein
MKKAIAILFVVLLILTMTVTAVSASHPVLKRGLTDTAGRDGIKNSQSSPSTFNHDLTVKNSPGKSETSDWEFGDGTHYNNKKTGYY